MLDFFKNHRKIIVNTDLVGLISALLLQNFLDCEVVGFCNSADKVYKDSTQKLDLREVLFVDMFVSHPKIACVDQHIVSYNNLHLSTLLENPLKLNPNLLRGKTFSPKENYHTKYPFGTCHFLLAILHRLSLEHNLSLFRENNNIMPIDFLLRADDAMYNTLGKYKNNCADWWKWLIEFSGNSETIKSITQNLQTFSGDPYQKKLEVSTYLKKEFNCDKPDGGFNTITVGNGDYKSEFIDFVDFLADIFQLKTLELPKSLDIIKGAAGRSNFQEKDFPDLVKNLHTGKKIFSYAFVKSENQEKNFSYTYL